MRRPRPATIASTLIAITLVGLAVTCATAVLAVTRAQHTVTVARTVVTRYLELDRTITREAVAEASYRRAPSSTGRIRLSNAMAAVHPALRAAQGIGDREDAAVVARLDRLNERYAGAVLSSLDRPAPAGSEDRVAGPALDEIEDLLTAAVDRHRAEAIAAVGKQGVVMHQLSFLLPTVFGIAFAVLGWTWSRMVRAHRRLHVEATDNRQRARTDTLTGLLNRSALLEAMTAALAAKDAAPALVYLDLDRFKPVNDRLGHHAGDELLQQVAQRLRASIRVEDAAARIGGDEFALLLLEADAAESVAERVVESLSEPFTVLGRAVTIGASAGLARCPEHGRDPGSLLVSADLALYEAKRAGRGRLRVAGAPSDDPLAV